MKFVKTKISEIIFYCAFFLIAFKTILYFSNLNLIPIPHEYLKYISIGAIGLLFIKSVIDNLKDFNKLILKVIAFVGIVAIALYTETTTISVLLAFLVSISTNIKIKNLAKIHLAIFLPSLLIHFVLGELQYKGIVDFEKMFSIMKNSSRGLYYFYCYYNTAACVCLGVLFSIITLVDDRHKLKTSYLLLPAVLFTYHLTTSRTYLAVYLLYLLVFTLAKINFVEKAIKFVSRYMVVILSTISLLLLKFKEISLIEKLDYYLANRIEYAYQGFEKYGYNFLPSKSIIEDFQSSNIILDNVYTRYMILYGLISIVIISIIFFVINKKLSRYVACAFVILTIAGIAENYTFDVGVTLIPLLVFHEYKKYKEVEKYKQDKKISVIVPNYNGGKYLKRCLKSLINQTYENIEIIVIDDGSTDKSKEIIKKYASKDNKIVFIDNENHGVSFSRNVGLEIAKGDYITFIDSDDFIKEDAYFELIKLVDNYDLDIIKFGFYRSYKFIDRKYKFKNITNKVINKDKVDDLLLSNDCCNIWNALIKSDIAKSIRFDSNLKMGEDYLYFSKCLAKANTIYFDKRCFYYYCFNTKSFTLNLNKDKLVKILDDTISVNKEIVDLGLSKKENIEIRNNYVIGENLEKLVIMSDYKEYQEYLDLLKDKDFEYSCSLNEFRIYKLKNIIKRFIIKCM